MVKYRVRNTGTEAARGVVLKVRLPGEVTPVETFPKRYNAVSGEMVFEPATILAGDETEYLVTYAANTPGGAVFRFALTHDGDPKPLTTDRTVTVKPAAP